MKSASSMYSNGSSEELTAAVDADQRGIQSCLMGNMKHIRD